MKPKVILLTVLLQGFAFCKEDYYWKPYRGEIPEDAVNASSSKDLYIGIGPGSDLSLGDYVGEILKGQTSILLPTSGQNYKYVDEHLLILCSGDVKALSWVEADYKVLHSIPNKVEAGYQANTHYNILGVQYIGRALVDGVYRVGQVPGFGVDDLDYANRLYVPDTEALKVINIDNYDVLVYSN